MPVSMDLHLAQQSDKTLEIDVAIVGGGMSGL